MNTTTTMPKTVRELGALADKLGVKPSELLAPAGFRLDESSFGDYAGGYWTGPNLRRQGLEGHESLDHRGGHDVLRRRQQRQCHPGR